ncbi:hypothetical protein [Paenibacillus sp. UMB7766-LJ446]|uniref:hypothetical protein n=1 Tax=Paenibacillus sp. UMB7766-LJ446 TaxID=3046313 RepID=UPI00254B3075|nr:hypothetical protein [Paenibacillus sp. UMB7766-LJ446]
MPEQPSDRCYPPDFFDFLFQRRKSGDKGERSASSGYFCPLRYRVNVWFNLSSPRVMSKNPYTSLFDWEI